MKNYCEIDMSYLYLSWCIHECHKTRSVHDCDMYIHTSTCRCTYYSINISPIKQTSIVYTFIS